MSWACPHDAGGECQQVPGKACDPGMKGCVLYGRVRFSVDDKNSPRIRRQSESDTALSRSDKTQKDSQ